jgi:hypothetical protein
MLTVTDLSRFAVPNAALRLSCWDVSPPLEASYSDTIRYGEHGFRVLCQRLINTGPNLVDVAVP